MTSRRERPADPLAAVQLLVMAKVPVAGAVKTRLARRVGDAAACALYAAFLDDLSARLAELPARVTWAWTDPSARPPDVGVRMAHVGQAAGDLGARMMAGLAEVWRRDSRPALVLGVDAPHVETAWLRAGATALLEGADLVLGPSHDGGYWTIGLRAPRPALFCDVPWGSDRAYAVTRARAVGLSVIELPATFDVDEWEDVAPLRRLLAGQATVLPATRRVLAAPPWSET